MKSIFCNEDSRMCSSVSCILWFPLVHDNHLLIYVCSFFCLGCRSVWCLKSILLILKFSNTENRVQLVIIKRPIIVTEIVIPDVEGCQLFSRWRYYSISCVFLVKIALVCYKAAKVTILHPDCLQRSSKNVKDMSNEWKIHVRADCGWLGNVDMTTVYCKSWLWMAWKCRYDHSLL
jgi:hypothetical protein